MSCKLLKRTPSLVRRYLLKPLKPLRQFESAEHPLICTSFCRINITNMSSVPRSFSAMKGMDISGIYPPITTPFDSSENIAYDELRNNILKWNVIPFRALEPTASESLLKLISYYCQADCFKACRCYQPGLKCPAMCEQYRGVLCANCAKHDTD